LDYWRDQKLRIPKKYSPTYLSFYGVFSRMKNRLLKGIRTYNRYRSPLAKAELHDFSSDDFEVVFRGNFDVYCCMDEYFVDLVYELKEVGIDADLVDFSLIEEGKYLAEYKILD